MQKIPRRVETTTELGLIVSTPSPELTPRSNSQRVVMTGGHGGDIGGKSRDRSGLISIRAHYRNRGGQAQSAIASVSKGEKSVPSLLDLGKSSC